MKTIDYYYSTRSNFTYLGAARLNALARAHGRRIRHRPILLSVTMPAIGGLPFSERPVMLRNYSMRDALRWADHLGVPVLREPVHHAGPVELPSGIVIAGQRAVARGETGDVDDLSLRVLQALWRDDRDIADATVVAELCRSAGFTSPDALVEEALTAGVQAELARNCQEAIVRGVIGAPTYFVDDEPFYGQDRLDFVERALSGAASREASG
ncbi:MAG TPA: 2-hydroxychromene-2-carboxylate isomerase [Thalassobaculum sp.]